jgi:hypothetical protein
MVSASSGSNAVPSIDKAAGWRYLRGIDRGRDVEGSGVRRPEVAREASPNKPVDVLTCLASAVLPAGTGFTEPTC